MFKTLWFESKEYIFLMQLLFSQSEVSKLYVQNCLKSPQKEHCVVIKSNTANVILTLSAVCGFRHCYFETHLWVGWQENNSFAKTNKHWNALVLDTVQPLWYAANWTKISAYSWLLLTLKRIYSYSSFLHKTSEKLCLAIQKRFMETF